MTSSEMQLKINRFEIASGQKQSNNKSVSTIVQTARRECFTLQGYL